MRSRDAHTVHTVHTVRLPCVRNGCVCCLSVAGTLKKVTTAVYSFWVACIPVVHRASARSLRHETLLVKLIPCEDPGARIGAHLRLS